MAKSRRWSAGLVLAGLLGTVLVGVPDTTATASAKAPGTAPRPVPPLDAAISPSGRGTAVPKLIDQRRNPEIKSRANSTVRSPLGVDGRPAGANLPTRAATGAKPAPTAVASQPAGPNAGPGQAPRAAAGPLFPPGTGVLENFNGINQAGGGGAQPSDVNASIGATQILETVNRRVTVFSKGSNGGVLCTNTLAGWLGLGTLNVFDPRTIYDNVNGRFIIIATTSGTTGVLPRLFLAAGTSSNACGSYFVYTLTFSGGSFATGMLLDYPYLGQDRTAILSSTNNFNPGYVNSTAWSVSKLLIETGAPVAFPSFAVAFSTAPVVVTGVPVGVTANTYFVAGRPGVGYNLYRMTNSAGPGTTLVLQAVVSASYNRPSRRVNQCAKSSNGTTVTLDPLDGRIPWAPTQAVNSPFVWFTHGIDVAGFPAIRYGAINTTTNTATVAVAWHSATSDDFNPSLYAYEESPNSFRIWLNWAYTQASPCVFTSTTFNGVVPGGGVPNLTGTDLTLANGSITTTNTRFGDYSSVAIDPTAAPIGRTALVAQQYFIGGSWATRLARITF